MPSPTFVHFNLPFPRVCKVCSKEIRSKSGLGTHLKNQHPPFSYDSYLLQHEGIDLKKMRAEWQKDREERRRMGIAKTVAHNKKLRLPPKDRLTTKQYNQWRQAMKRVFTLPWHIEKYGKRDGKRRYKKRSVELSKNNGFRTYNSRNKSCWSNVSQELFWQVYNSTLFKTVYFGELNHEFSCGLSSNYDFVVKDVKRIIEFNGDTFHANPRFYGEDFKQPFTNKAAKKVWEEDAVKVNRAIHKGYEVMIIWENEYRRDKLGTVQRCVEYLTNGFESSDRYAIMEA